MTRRLGISVVCLAVLGLALLRMPMSLVYEEPFEFWDRVPTMSPLAYLIEPWAGYVVLSSRAGFLVAYPFGEGLGPFVTRLFLAGIIAALAGLLLTARTAIPSPAVRVLT